MKNLVSVIIPIYNTEKYLDKCIKSVLCQKYSNFELILVNDGSTDNSEEICNYYKSRDTRIIVIRQENQGQGVARNNALKVANGDFVTFLDSDDYWDDDYLETMVNIMLTYKADISICAYRFENEKYEFLRKSVKYEGDNVIEYSGVEAANNMLYWIDFGVAPWAKMYKKNIWNELKFPEDRIYEDLSITYLASMKAKKVVFTTEDKMAYILRKNSDIRMPFNLKKIKVLDTADEILERAFNEYPLLIRAAKSRIVATSFFILFQLPTEIKEYQYVSERCKSNIKKYRLEVIFDKKSRKKTRLGALASYFGFDICKNIFVFLKRRDMTF